MEKKLVIAMSRQFTTGGHYVGEKVAELLGMKFYDGEMIADIVAQGGLDHYTYTEVPAAHHVYEGGYVWEPDEDEFAKQSEVIRQLAERGNCVICGRCADYLLRDDPNCVRLFFGADFDYRLADFVAAYHMPPEDVAGNTEKLKGLDAGRIRYYKRYTGEDWAQISRFHLAMNLTPCGQFAAVDVVMSYLKACGRI